MIITGLFGSVQQTEGAHTRVGSVQHNCESLSLKTGGTKSGRSQRDAQTDGVMAAVNQLRAQQNQRSQRSAS